MNVREWLDGRSERERQLVYLAAGVACVALLFVVLVLPFRALNHRMEARVDKKSSDLAWMRQVAPQLSAAAASLHLQGTGESLVVVVNRTARQAGLGAALRDQSPDGKQGLRLRLESAPFDAMVTWLASLQQQYGVSIDAATVDGAKPGLVNASLTLSRPTAG